MSATTFAPLALKIAQANLLSGVIESYSGFSFVKAADAIVNPAQQKIRARLQANNRKSRNGKKYRRLKWVLSLQAQCAIHGHVHKQNGMACYFCGYEFE